MKLANLGTGALGMMFGGLLLAFSAASVQAQQPAPQPQQQVQDLEQETLETFAEAYLDIGDVRMEMQSRLENVQDQSQANQIQQEANQQMQAILEEHDLTAQDYQQITQVLNNDPEQRAEFESIVEDLQDEDS